jgi:undecaprenyl-diphosphatase
MSRVVSWLQAHEHRIFFLVNRRIQHIIFDHIFSKLTHLGGATVTILVSLFISLFGRGAWQTAGIQCCIALLVSHIPVAWIKKRYPRLRPYMVLPEAKTYHKPLKDHSFPSGHTTAIFSVIVPFVCAAPWLSAVLLPLASIVAVSRIYLGLHYPSDCLVGCMIGTLTALSTVAFFS